METRETNKPTSGTTELTANNHTVQIYNYCPCCRGELASCSMETEFIISKDGKWSHFPYKSIQQRYWELASMVNSTPPDRRNGTWITITASNSNKFEMTLHEFLEIYKIMARKHIETI